MRVLEIRTKTRKREIKTANYRVKVMIATALRSKVTAFFLFYSSRSETRRKFVKTPSLDAVSEMLFFSNCIFILLNALKSVLSGDSNLVLLSQEN